MNGLVIITDDENIAKDWVRDLDLSLNDVVITTLKDSQKVLEEEKPLLILCTSNKVFRKLSQKGVRMPVLGADSIEELYKKHVYVKLEYDAHFNFKNYGARFKSKDDLWYFMKHANKFRLQHVGSDKNYNNVLNFVANKQNFRVQFDYFNYCWVECEDQYSEKKTIFGKPVRKLHYKYLRELDGLETHEDDIHEDYRFIIDYSDYFLPITKQDLIYTSFDIETDGSVDIINTPKPIISIVYSKNGQVEFLMLDNERNNYEELAKKKDVKIYSSEKQLIKDFAKVVRETNVLTGFNINGFDLCYLFNRGKKLGVKETEWSPFGKIFNSIKEEKDRSNALIMINGVDLVDTMLFAKDKFFVYSFNKPSQYNLDYLGKFLGLGEKVADPRGPGTQWREDPQVLYDYNVQDVVLNEKIDEYVRLVDYMCGFKELIPTLNLQWSLYNSKIIDFFILCKYSKDYVFPSKKNFEKEEIEGAYVMSPIDGMYRNVAIFDFSSLYPNIMRQFNISTEVLVEDKKGAINIGDTFFFSKEREGITKQLVTDIMYMKNDISKLMKEDDDPKLLTRYNSIKAVINGIYGVFGYNKFRLYDARIANAVTTAGRDLTHALVDIVNSFENLKVIYGDTDSVFVHLEKEMSHEKAIQYFEHFTSVLNEKLSEYVLEKYGVENQYIEVDCETVFDRLMQTRAKKKYFGVGRFIKGKLHEENKDYGRGIDIIKKDTPSALRPILLDLLVGVVNSDSDDEIKKVILSAKDRIFELPFHELLITKQISRELEEYAVAPQHVKAMLWSNENLGTNFSRSNYKGGMLYVKGVSVDAVMLEENMELPKFLSVDYEKYFNLFVKNKMLLFSEMFKRVFVRMNNNTLDQWIK